MYYTFYVPTIKPASTGDKLKSVPYDVKPSLILPNGMFAGTTGVSSKNYFKQ